MREFSEWSAFADRSLARLDWAGRKAVVQERLRFLRAGDDDAATARAFADAGAALAPGFLRLLAAGHDALAARKDEMAPVGTTRTCPSARSRDILRALRHGAKLAVCPWTERLSRASYSVGSEAFAFVPPALPPFLVLQITHQWEPREDTCYVFPTLGLALSVAGSLHELNQKKSVEILSNFVGKLGLELPLSAREYSGIAVVELSVPHFGHYFWNCLPGMSDILEDPDDRQRVGGVFQWTMNRLGPRATELWPDLQERPHGEFDRNQELMAACRTHGLLPMTAIASEIAPSLAARVIDHAARHMSDATRAAFAALAIASPIVGFSIRLGNRCWLGQEDGFVAVARSIRDRWPAAGFVIDGMSGDTTKGWSHALMSITDEEALAERLSARIGAFAPCVSVVGRPGNDAIAAAALCDAFVAPAGSGLVKQRWLANKPGVVMSNSESLGGVTRAAQFVRVFENHRAGLVPSTWLQPHEVTDIPNATRPSHASADYEVSPALISARLTDVLSSLGH